MFLVHLSVIWVTSFWATWLVNLEHYIRNPEQQCLMHLLVILVSNLGAALRSEL
jgi:uncharacterized membrane protein YwzB